MEIHNRINRKIHFCVYYDLLWNAAYQHDLNKATSQRQRKVFISHQNDPCDDFEHDPEEDSTDDQNQDEPHTQSFSLPSILLHLRNLPKFLFPINSGESSLKLCTTKRSKWLVLNHISMGAS